MRVKTTKKYHLYDYIEEEVKNGYTVPRPTEMDTYLGAVKIIFKRVKNIIHVYRYDPDLYRDELYLFSYNLKNKRGE